MTCGGCVGTTVGGLTGLFSKSLCGWCAVDGHSSNIGYCVGSVSMCKTLQTSVLKKNFGPGGRVRFNDGITAMTQWRCPDEMEMLVRSCERGCDLRCDEQKKEEWYVCLLWCGNDCRLIIRLTVDSLCLCTRVCIGMHRLCPCVCASATSSKES